jgi:predicted nucleic acid-binding Zn ribbon protein
MTHAEKTRGHRKCPYCGTQFTLNSPNQKFCSYHCRWDNRAELRTLQRRCATYGDLKLNPVWDTLRGDPRFEKIVASLAPKKQ